MYLGGEANHKRSNSPDDTYKFLVSLQKNKKHVCGGFLISEDFVLTAAHCSAEEPDRVVVGTHDLSKVGEENIRYIEKRYKHRSYYQVDKGNDIMLLKLTRNVAGNKKQIIALPPSNMHIQEKKTCHVAGWGFTKTGGGVVDRLMVVDVSVINLNTCSKSWGGIPSDVICAGGYDSHKGFCQGDSGGPLVCDGIAVGVVSFNNYKICDYPNKPNVYTEISKYLGWINNDTYKFLVSLQKNNKHVCGGFLISEDFVLTAAHCSAEEPDRVVVGTHDLSKVGEENIRYIEKRYKHRSYYQVDKGNDIMLLKLTRNVAGNKKQIIALPPSNMHIQEKKTCHVAGWGFTKTGGGVVDRLMVVDVSVINLNTCSKSWGGIPSDVICAGGYDSHKGFCQGDSGGPLVCDGIAVGVVSFNYYKICDFPNKPNVYTEISKYLGWINILGSKIINGTTPAMI
ncbi:hypothetical protein F7725_008105 [Dissostichus mawsoni]|uniref:Peptidase S1 domain-containing protein n=1 Tax=Dissostichus mawsoni TaxID=36200 RepID=A0A7J5Y681_DISMA|nr:hypothetical protein F7725_008105 [Dissostichus mawsoni]